MSRFGTPSLETPDYAKPLYLDAFTRTLGSTIANDTLIGGLGLQANRIGARIRSGAPSLFNDPEGFDRPEGARILYNSRPEFLEELAGSLDTDAESLIIEAGGDRATVNDLHTAVRRLRYNRDIAEAGEALDPVSSFAAQMTGSIIGDFPNPANFIGLGSAFTVAKGIAPALRVARQSGVSISAASRIARAESTIAAAGKALRRQEILSARVGSFAQPITALGSFTKGSLFAATNGLIENATTELFLRNLEGEAGERDVWGNTLYGTALGVGFYGGVGAASSVFRFALRNRFARSLADSAHAKQVVEGSAMDAEGSLAVRTAETSSAADHLATRLAAESDSIRGFLPERARSTLEISPEAEGLIDRLNLSGELNRINTPSGEITTLDIIDYISSFGLDEPRFQQAYGALERIDRDILVDLLEETGRLSARTESGARFAAVNSTPRSRDPRFSEARGYVRNIVNSLRSKVGQSRGTVRELRRTLRDRFGLNEQQIRALVRWADQYAGLKGYGKEVTDEPATPTRREQRAQANEARLRERAGREAASEAERAKIPEVGYRVGDLTRTEVRNALDGTSNDIPNIARELGVSERLVRSMLESRYQIQTNRSARLDELEQSYREEIAGQAEPEDIAAFADTGPLGESLGSLLGGDVAAKIGRGELITRQEGLRFGMDDDAYLDYLKSYEDEYFSSINRERFFSTLIDPAKDEPTAFENEFFDLLEARLGDDYIPATDIPDRAMDYAEAATLYAEIKMAENLPEAFPFRDELVTAKTRAFEEVLAVVRLTNQSDFRFVSRDIDPDASLAATLENSESYRGDSLTFMDLMGETYPFLKNSFQGRSPLSEYPELTNYIQDLIEQGHTDMVTLSSKAYERVLELQGLPRQIADELEPDEIVQELLAPVNTPSGNKAIPVFTILGQIQRSGSANTRAYTENINKSLGDLMTVSRATDIIPGLSSVLPENHRWVEPPVQLRFVQGKVIPTIWGYNAKNRSYSKDAFLKAVQREVDAANSRLATEAAELGEGVEYTPLSVSDTFADSLNFDDYQSLPERYVEQVSLIRDAFANFDGTPTKAIRRALQDWSRLNREVNDMANDGGTGFMDAFPLADQLRELEEDYGTIIPEVRRVLVEETQKAVYQADPTRPALGDTRIFLSDLTPEDGTVAANALANLAAKRSSAPSFADPFEQSAAALSRGLSDPSRARLIAEEAREAYEAMKGSTEDPTASQESVEAFYDMVRLLGHRDGDIRASVYSSDEARVWLYRGGAPESPMNLFGTDLVADPRAVDAQINKATSYGVFSQEQAQWLRGITDTPTRHMVSAVLSVMDPTRRNAFTQTVRISRDQSLDARAVSRQFSNERDAKAVESVQELIDRRRQQADGETEIVLGPEADATDALHEMLHTILPTTASDADWDKVLSAMDRDHRRGGASRELLSRYAENFQSRGLFTGEARYENLTERGRLELAEEFMILNFGTRMKDQTLFSEQRGLFARLRDFTQWVFLRDPNAALRQVAWSINRRMRQSPLTRDRGLREMEVRKGIRTAMVSVYNHTVGELRKANARGLTRREQALRGRLKALEKMKTIFPKNYIALRYAGADFTGKNLGTLDADVVHAKTNLVPYWREEMQVMQRLERGNRIVNERPSLREDIRDPRKAFRGLLQEMFNKDGRHSLRITRSNNSEGIIHAPSARRFDEMLNMTEAGIMSASSDIEAVAGYERSKVKGLTNIIGILDWDTVARRLYKSTVRTKNNELTKSFTALFENNTIYAGLNKRAPSMETLLTAHHQELGTVKNAMHKLMHDWAIRTDRKPRNTVDTLTRKVSDRYSFEAEHYIEFTQKLQTALADGTRAGLDKEIIVAADLLENLFKVDFARGVAAGLFPNADFLKNNMSKEGHIRYFPQLIEWQKVRDQADLWLSLRIDELMAARNGQFGTIPDSLTTLRKGERVPISDEAIEAKAKRELDSIRIKRNLDSVSDGRFNKTAPISSRMGDRAIVYYDTKRYAESGFFQRDWDTVLNNYHRMWRVQADINTAISGTKGRPLSEVFDSITDNRGPALLLQTEDIPKLREMTDKTLEKIREGNYAARVAGLAKAAQGKRGVLREAVNEKIRDDFYSKFNDQELEIVYALGQNATGIPKGLWESVFRSPHPRAERFFTRENKGTRRWVMNYLDKPDYMALMYEADVRMFDDEISQQGVTDPQTQLLQKARDEYTNAVSFINDQVRGLGEDTVSERWQLATSVMTNLSSAMNLDRLSLSMIPEMANNILFNQGPDGQKVLRDFATALADISKNESKESVQEVLEFFTRAHGSIGRGGIFDPLNERSRGIVSKMRETKPFTGALAEGIQRGSEFVADAGAKLGGSKLIEKFHKGFHYMVMNNQIANNIDRLIKAEELLASGATEAEALRQAGWPDRDRQRGVMKFIRILRQNGMDLAALRFIRDNNLVHTDDTGFKAIRATQIRQEVGQRLLGEAPEEAAMFSRIEQAIEGVSTVRANQMVTQPDPVADAFQGEMNSFASRAFAYLMRFVNGSTRKFLSNIHQQDTKPIAQWMALQVGLAAAMNALSSYILNGRTQELEEKLSTPSGSLYFLTQSAFRTNMAASNAMSLLSEVFYNGSVEMQPTLAATTGDAVRLGTQAFDAAQLIMNGEFDLTDPDSNRIIRNYLGSVPLANIWYLSGPAQAGLGMLQEAEDTEETNRQPLSSR